MVRIEKALYEQFVNINMLKRGRSLQAPSKWYTENRTDAMMVAGQKVFLEGITGTIFKAMEPIVSKFTYKWWQDIALQRGLALEDFFLHQDRELRRCFLFEKMARESLHPYQWLFMKKRRARYYKCERALRGMYMPEHIRQDAQARLFADTVENKQEWEDFVYTQYMADQTPNFRWSILGKWNALDIIMPHGLWRGEAWDRYFLNEKFYEEYTQDDINASFAKVYPQDLDTQAGRQSFEDQVNGFIQLYPNSIVKEGEEYNFQKLYAKVALLKGKDTSSFDASLISDLKKELETESVGLIEGDAPKTGSGKSIGKIMPEFVRPAAGSGYFAK